MTEKLGGIYTRLCGEHGIKVDGQLLGQIAECTALRTVELDLRKVYVSKTSLPVIAEMVKICSNLTTLNASHSQLGNDGLEVLAQAIEDHPSLTFLNLSNNPLSLPSAKRLFAMVQENPNLVKIDITGTDISDAYRDRIELQTTLNASRGYTGKDLSNDDGDPASGLGKGAAVVRKRLGLPPPNEGDDEEWEWDSNLDDHAMVCDRMAKEKAETWEEMVVTGVQSPEIDDEEDDDIILPTVQGVPPVVENGDDHAACPLLNPMPVRPQKMSQIVESLFDSPSGTKWTDPHFPPSPECLVTRGGRALRERRCKGIRWVRAPDVPGCQYPTLFADPVHPSAPVMGVFADAWLGSVLAALVRHPAVLTRLFGKVHPDIGAYQVRVCKSGTWHDVIVDDWLPCDETGVVGMRATDPNELWVSLLEKAYAKLHHGYDRIERGSSTLALSDITGGITHAIYLRDHARVKEVLADSSYWNTLRGYLVDGWLLTASAKVSTQVERAALSDIGIAANRLYEVVDLAVVGSWSVVQLFCPECYVDTEEVTSKQVWLSREWADKLPEEHSKAILWRMARYSLHNGVFRWITWENFAVYFNKVYVTRYSDPSASYQSNIQRVSGQWIGSCAGGKLREQYFTENPCWALRVKHKSTPVLVQLAQPDSRLCKPGKGDPEVEGGEKIGMYIVKHPGDGGRKKRYWSRDEAVVMPSCFPNYREVTTEVVCQPLVTYYVIPCTESPGVTSRFQLTFASPHPFSVHEVDSVQDHELKCCGAWRGLSAAGRPACSPQWTNNPQFSLQLFGSGYVALSLHQKNPTPFYISFLVFAHTRGLKVEEYKSSNVVLSVDFAPYKTVTTEGELEEGLYTVVPMTWSRGEEADYELSVFTPLRAILEPIKSLATISK
eukprot:Sspe_Gene.107069::Locus_85141_Transcript_1_1_Confidence_1.000_Length_2724::g.107069::m.107069